MRPQFIVFCLSCLIVVFHPEGGQTKGRGLRSVLRLPWQKRLGREFIRGVGSSIPISRGDVLVSSLKINSFVVIPPYRWFYAVDPNHVVSFMPPVRKWLRETQLKLVNVREDFPRMKLQNRRKKPDDIGKAGILVATLMVESGIKLPFHMFFCYGKHYVEYFARGKAQGKWYKVSHNRMNKSCPLRAPLTSDMAWNIYLTRRFVLKDALNQETLLEIAAWPDYVRNLHMFC